MSETVPPTDQLSGRKVESSTTTLPLHVVLRIFEVLLVLVALIMTAVIASNNIYLDKIPVTTPKGPTDTALATLKLEVDPSGMLNVWTDPAGAINYIQNKLESHSFNGHAVEVTAGGNVTLLYQKHDILLNILVEPEGRVMWSVPGTEWLPAGPVSTHVPFPYDLTAQVSVVTNQYDIISYKFRAGEPWKWFYGTDVVLLADSAEKSKTEIRYRKGDSDLEVDYFMGQLKFTPTNASSTRLVDIGNSGLKVIVTPANEIQYTINPYARTPQVVTFDGTELMVVSNNVQFHFTKENKVLEVTQSSRQQAVISAKWNVNFTGKVAFHLLVSYGVEVAVRTSGNSIYWTLDGASEANFEGTEVGFLAGKIQVTYQKGEPKTKVKVSKGDTIEWTGGNSNMLTLQLAINSGSTLSLWTGSGSVIYYKEGTGPEKKFPGNKVTIASAGKVQLDYRRGDSKLNVWVTPDLNVIWKNSFNESSEVKATIELEVKPNEELFLFTNPIGIICYRKDATSMKWFEGSAASVSAGDNFKIHYSRGDAELSVSVAVDGSAVLKGGGKSSFTIELHIFKGDTITLWTGGGGAIYYRKDNGLDVRFDGTDALVVANLRDYLHYKKYDGKLTVTIDSDGKTTWKSSGASSVERRLNVLKGTTEYVWTNPKGVICYRKNNASVEMFPGTSLSLLADGKVEIPYAKGDSTIEVRVGDDGSVTWSDIQPTPVAPRPTPDAEARRIEIFTLVLLVFTLIEAVVIIIAFSLYDVSGGEIALGLLISDAILAIIYIFLTTLFEIEYIRTTSSNTPLSVMETVLLLAISIVLLFIICNDYFMWKDYERTDQNENVTQKNDSIKQLNDNVKLQNDNVKQQNDNVLQQNYNGEQQNDNVK